MSQDTAIQVTNLSKKYLLKYPVKDVEGNVTKEHWALNDVSFEIKKGEAVGIIGPNGSGKSTLLKIMSGVTKPTSGSVEISGRVASILDIGAGFHQELSGKENVFLNGQLLGFSYKEIKKQYDVIVEFSGIGNFIDEPVKNYSNGMYLRLAFSILAHLDFDVYLFDEVLYVGDTEFSLKCEAVLQNLISVKKTVVIVSHNNNEIIKYCNTFILLKEGKLLSKGKQIDKVSDYVEKILKKPVDFSNLTIFDEVLLPQNLKIKKISLVNFNNFDFDENNPYFREDKLKFLMEFSNFDSSKTYDISISIQNIWGSVVLTSSPIGSDILYKESETGNFKIECTFQEDFFNVGILFLNVTLIENKSRVALYLNKCLSLTVKTKQQFNHIGHELKEFSCLIAPKLHWTNYQKMIL